MSGGITIKNPGTGQQAFVTEDGQLLARAESLSLQHFISRYRGQSYSAVFWDATMQAGANVVAHITNESPSLSLVVKDIQLQVVDLSGGTALPAAVNYWTTAFGRARDSGGADVTPVNLSRRSGNTANVTAYDGDPTLSGTALEFDRYYPPNSEQHIIMDDGAIILGTADSMELTFNTDHTAGVGYARVTFLMMDLSETR